MKSNKNYLIILMLLLASSMGFAQNYALSLDGVNDEIEIIDATELNPTGPFSFEVWINADAWDSQIWGGSILSKQATGPDQGYNVTVGNSGSVEFNVGTGSWQSCTTGPILDLNTWYHIACVYDVTNMYLYINGELEASTVVSGTFVAPTGVNLMIGDNPTWSGRQFSGKVDEVRIWNVAKSASEIIAAYATELDGTEDDLIAYWNMNEGTGLTAGDQSSNSNDGTLMNMDETTDWVGGFEIPTCPDPVNLSAENITTTSADFSWSETGTATTWDIEWGSAGFTPTGEPTEEAVSSNPFSVSTLSSSNNYEFYIRSNCGVDDYSEWVGPFAFATLATCPVPTALDAIDITSSSATIVWSSGGASNYNFVYGPQGFNMEDSIYTALTDTFIVLSDLLDNYAYEFYVRDSCGAEDKSFWVGPMAFNTECGSAIPDYMEDFSTYMPGCWEEAKGELANPTEFTSTTSSSWLADGFANSGYTGAARMNVYYTNKFEWLISKPIDLGESNDMQLEFDLAFTDYANSNPPESVGEDDKFAVVISTDNGATWNLSDALRLWENSGTYIMSNISHTGEHVIIDLSAYTGIIKIGFYAETTVSNADNDLFIDNFRVRVAPTCNEPTALTATNITGFEAELSWLEQGTASLWNIEVIEFGTTPEGIPTESGVSNPYVYSTDINPETTYQYYVQSDCGDEDLSLWSGPFTFTTDVSCPAPSNIELSEFTATSATFTWESGGASNWNVEYGEFGFELGTGTNTAVTALEYTATDLLPSTTYQFYVQDSCGNADASVWVGPISVTTTSSCPQPTDLDAQTTDITANLSWEGYFAINWDIEWGEAGFTQTYTPNIENISDNPYTLTDLTGETTYEFYVRADCGEDNVDTSTWAGPFSFTTLMTPLTNPTECGVGLAETGGCLQIPILVSGVAETDLFREFRLINPHVWDSDLDISIESPEGITVDLSSGNGGSGDNYGAFDETCEAYTAFNMSGSDGNITAGSAPFIGSYIPEGNFADINSGADLNGIWILHICDTYASADDGSFEFAELIFAPINTENDIIAYTFPEQTPVASEIDAEAHTILIEVSNGTDPDGLVATFELSEYATTNVDAIEQTSSVTPNTFVFDTPFAYNVVAEDGTVQIWNVTVTEAAAYAETDILAFEFDDQIEEPVINSTDHTVTATVSWLADLENLSYSYSLSFEATTDQTTSDFLNPVTFNVMAQDGINNQDWIVTVNQQETPQGATCANPLPLTLPVVNEIGTTENFGDIYSNGTMDCSTSYINGDEIVYEFTLSEEGFLSGDLTTTDSWPGMLILDGCPDEATTTCIVTATGSGQYQSFENEMISAGTYFLIISSFPSPQTIDFDFNLNFEPISDVEILTFTIPDQIESVIVVESDSIHVQMPLGTDLNGLIANFTVSEDVDSVAVDFTKQISGETPNNWAATGTVYYILAGLDGITYEEWQVVVEKDLFSENEILTFTIPDQLGDTYFDTEDDSIHITMPFGTILSGLIPTFTLSEGAIAKVGVVTQVSESTANNWTGGSVIYTVIAEDGTEKNWTVSVEIEPNNENEILTYTISGQTESNIVLENDSIHVTMNEAITEIDARIADFTISEGASIFVGTTPQETGETINDFSQGPVFYTVIAEDGTEREWQVVVDFHDYNVGIKNITESNDLKVYPNPNQGKFNLEISLEYLISVNLEVVNAQGQVVANFEDVKTNISKSIDLSELATGIYYIKVITENETMVRKVNILK